MRLGLPILLLSLTSCGSANRLAQDRPPGASDGATRISQTQVEDPSLMMLRSNQSENGFYGKEAEAEINQILRFLEN